MAVVLTFDFHQFKLFNRDSPQALVKVIGLGSSDIGEGKSALSVNYVIVLEKRGSHATLTHVDMVKASIQGTEMSVHQSTLNAFPDW